MTPIREVEGVEGTRFAAITIVRETGSTNRDLLEAAIDGAPEGRVLITDHQTAGRGRQGRVWVDDPGSSLLCSVLLRPPLAWASFVPLATGLAIVEAVRGWGIELGLKWPNDVLADIGAPDASATPDRVEGRAEPDRVEERKVCGILAEAITTGVGADVGAADGAIAVVVGFGFNLAWTDPERLGPEVVARGIDLAGLMARAGRPDETPDRLTLARAVLGALESQLERLDRSGPEDLLRRYRPVCRTLGREVRFETPGGVLEGVAVDVSPDGGLVIDTTGQRAAMGQSPHGGGLVVVHAGDAHHI